MIAVEEVIADAVDVAFCNGYGHIAVWIAVEEIFVAARTEVIEDRDRC